MLILFIESDSNGKAKRVNFKARESVSDDSYVLYNEERRMKRNAESGLFEKPF